MAENNTQRPLILLSNDDGVEAPGLAALAASLGAAYDVLIVAPEGQRSAASHAVSLVARWRVTERSPGVYAVDGTPADCVYLGVCLLAKRRPALVISGINDGFNMGTDVVYSGTVAAAAEATVLGIPGIAVSTDVGAGSATYELGGRFVAALTKWVLSQGWAPPWTLLNVNVPQGGSPERYAVGAMGTRHYAVPAKGDFVMEEGGIIAVRRPYSAGVSDARGEEAAIVRRGFISVTPLRLDWTATEELSRLNRLRLHGFESVRAKGDGWGDES